MASTHFQACQKQKSVYSLVLLSVDMHEVGHDVELLWIDLNGVSVHEFFRAVSAAQRSKDECIFLEVDD